MPAKKEPPAPLPEPRGRTEVPASKLLLLSLDRLRRDYVAAERQLLDLEAQERGYDPAKTTFDRQTQRWVLQD